jgi:hypothetical protein
MGIAAWLASKPSWRDVAGQCHHLRTVESSVMLFEAVLGLRSESGVEVEDAGEDHCCWRKMVHLKDFEERCQVVGCWVTG